MQLYAASGLGPADIQNAILYIHGLSGVAEGIRPIRGTAANPAPDVEHVLVTAGTGIPTSGLILESM